MIISEKNQKSNRQNAQHSTGPKTTEGKAAIRFNALTYGLRTRATVLESENAADYSRLWDELEADWQPQDRTERCYLETMVTSQWLLARVADRERKVYEFIEFGEKQFVMLGYVSKQRAQLERSFRTAIEDMKQSQKERQARQPQQRECLPADNSINTGPSEIILNKSPRLCHREMDASAQSRWLLGSGEGTRTESRVPASSNWSAHWRRTSACGSNWNKRCELTSEAPHRFPRGNPKVTLSRRDASLARHTGSGPPDRFPAGWMSKSPYRSRRTAHTVTVR